MNNILIYVSKDGKSSVDVNLENDDIWMSQEVMANLYDTTKQNISYHLNNIFKEKELDKNSVVKDFLTTASDSKKYNVLHYNLDAIIAVGYRINSKKATEFRIWATKILKEYMTKGFALNDERFINGNKYDSKYFDELLERIKTIRVNELDAFLKMTRKDILNGSGKITHEQALKKAHEEYDKYMKTHLTTAEQDYLDVLNKKIEELE